MEDSKEASLYQCEICSKVYKQKQNLKRHMKNIHEVISCSVHKCDICDKEFDLEAYLTNQIWQCMR